MKHDSGMRMVHTGGSGLLAMELNMTKMEN